MNEQFTASGIVNRYLPHIIRAARKIERRSISHLDTASDERDLHQLKTDLLKMVKEAENG